MKLLNCVLISTLTTAAFTTATLLALQSGAQAQAGPTAPSSAAPMAGMNMSNNASASPSMAHMEMNSKLPNPGMGPNGNGSDSSGDAMAGMDMSGGMNGMKMSDTAKPDMSPLVMPQLKQMGTYVVTGNEDWAVKTGFGKNAGMVGMMTKMMVGGSGMEGMKMTPMAMHFGKQNYTQDASDTGNTAPANAAMSGMDMSKSAVPESPATPATPAMPQSPPLAKPISNAAVPSAGGTPAPTMTAPVPLKITGTISSPKAGDNVMTVKLVDSMGAPVTGAKISSTVAMTTMDMGTTHPLFKDMGNGKYISTVSFGMAGPWRVVIAVHAKDNTTAHKVSFVFNAK